MKSLKVILLSLFASAAVLAQPQTGVLAGRVVLENNEPAASASVTLDQTKLGTATKEDGSFVISGIPVGTYVVKVRLVGYEQIKPLSAKVISNDTAFISIVLRENEIEMSQILVTGNRRQAAQDTRPSVTTITPREAKYLPGAAEDVLRGLQALPGVTSVSDFSSQLVVRGSGPDQNLIMIDGFEVINPYRLYGIVSMFNPETVSDISLQTGGFAAQYGDRLSAVIDVKNREGRSDVPFAAKLNFSLTNLNLIFEGALPVDGSSYLLSVRRTYYDLILGPILKKAKLIEGDVALPNFRDAQFRAVFPVSESNKLIINALTSRDGASVISGADRQTADSVNLFDQSYNSMIGASWLFNPSKEVLVTTQLSWYQNKGSGAFDGTFVDPSQSTGTIGRTDTVGIRFVRFGVDYDYYYTKVSLAQRLMWNSSVHSVEAGYGVDWLRTDYLRNFQIDDVLKQEISQRGFIVPTDQTETIRYGRYNACLQDRISVGDRLFIQPGVRADFYPVLKVSSYFSPRLNISYKIDDLTTLRAAYGIYYQSPGMEKQVYQGQLMFSDQAFATLDAEKASHYIFGLDRMVTAAWQFKLDTYYKDFRNIIVPQKLQGSTWVSHRTADSIFSLNGWTTPVRTPGDSLTSFPVNDATGESYGFEVMLQKIRNQASESFTGWVSYALSYANRNRDGISTPFLFDQRHAVNIVGNYRLGESWDMGVRFTLRSGRPYFRALGVKPRVLIVTHNGVDTPVIQTDKQGRVILDVDYERDAYSGRLNMYHSLDLRLTTYPAWWGLNWSVYLDIQNILNHQNQQTLAYYVDSTGNLQSRAVNGIPIFPSLGLSVNL